MLPIKGKFIKKPTKPLPNLAEDVGSVVALVTQLNKTNDTIDAKLADIEEIKGEVKDTLDEVKNTIASHSDAIKGVVEDVQAFTENLKQEAISTIKEIKQGDAGRDGKDADETEIVEKVLAKVPKLDEKKLTKKILSQIPDRKADLKIIQESIEIDPMSVIEKIMALPEEKRKKLQLSSDNISGLQQTMHAFQSQLGRGYLHGGGISNITGLIQAGTDISITGNGTQTSPYIINATGTLALETNGTPNGSQTLLNLVDGTGISITDDGFGNITITNTGGPGIQDLEEVLTVGNSTGDIPIISPDTLNSLEISDTNGIYGFTAGNTYDFWLDTAGNYSLNTISIYETAGHQRIVADDSQGVTLGNDDIYFNISTTDLVTIAATGEDPFVTVDIPNLQVRVTTGGATTPLDGPDGLGWNPVIVAQSVDSYSAIDSYNRSATTAATADFIAANDADDGSILGGHFIDMGINSSVYDSSISGLYTGGPNAGYIMVNGGPLTLMTQKTHPIYFVTGGYTSANFVRGNIAANSPNLSMGLRGGGTGIFTIVGDGAGSTSITGSSDSTQQIFKNVFGNTVQILDSNLSAIYSGRVQEKRGADVTAASTITLGLDGNYFHITGNTAIDYITTTNWQDGACITLCFTGKGAMNSNSASPGAGTAKLLLQNNTNWVGNTKNETFIFRYDAGLSVWIQITPVSSH